MEVVYRALIFYIWSILLLRLLGKSLTFQQKPYDFVVMMIIGSASAALMINREVPIVNGLVALVVLAVLHTIISVSSLNNYLKNIIGGQPDVLIRNSQIIKANLIKNQINLNQLMSGLRYKGFHKIHDVEYALLEANGQLSVIPKSQKRPLKPEDIQIETDYEGLTIPLIVDGVLKKKNLEPLDIDQEWLEKKISEKGLTMDQVLLAQLDTSGNLYLAEQPSINSIKAFFVGEKRKPQN